MPQAKPTTKLISPIQKAEELRDVFFQCLYELTPGVIDELQGLNLPEELKSWPNGESIEEFFPELISWRDKHFPKLKKDWLLNSAMNFLTTGFWGTRIFARPFLPPPVLPHYFVEESAAEYRAKVLAIVDKYIEDSRSVALRQGFKPATEKHRGVDQKAVKDLERLGYDALLKHSKYDERLERLEYDELLKYAKRLEYDKLLKNDKLLERMHWLISHHVLGKKWTDIAKKIKGTRDAELENTIKISVGRLEKELI